MRGEKNVLVSAAVATVWVGTPRANEKSSPMFASNPGCLLTIPHAFHHHEPDGLQRPVIKPAAISLHASIIKGFTRAYKQMVDLSHRRDE